MGLLSRFLQSEEKDAKEQPVVENDSQRLIVANWKCHKTFDEARRWFDEFAGGYVAKPNVDVIVAPSFICLENISRYVKELGLENLYLAAQDVSPFPRGAYTGAVAADMVKGLVDYVIVGHSDRRRYFNETSMDVTNKVVELADLGLCPIVCVDQPYTMSQLTSLSDIECENMIVGYSPVDALSFRIPESPEKVSESVDFIRGVFPNRPVIYGGSLTPENVAEYFTLPGLSGVFLGSSSLDADTFLEICHQV